MNITKETFGKTKDEKTVDIYTLTNDNAMTAKIINYGGIVVSLTAPDRNRKMDDVVLGYDNLDDYIKDNDSYFGAIVGRYGSRIAKGKFTLEGNEYTLAQNNGENSLHGGIKGFNKVLWQAEPFKKADAVGLKLKYLSRDGEEGFPGNLNVTVIYTLTNNNELKIDNKATTDKTTVVNMTHHSYFNLKGHGEGNILDHLMMINADKFTPTDADSIPTGELADVKGTPMDFTKPIAIGDRIEIDYEQLKFGSGYDHNWVINKKSSELELAARAIEKSTGRIMELYTTCPGVQFYTGNFLDDNNVGKGGKVYRPRYGFCLEPQHFPDTPNKPEFPSCTLAKGKTYTHNIVYKFSAEK